MINVELRNILTRAYRCSGFDGPCCKMRWSPTQGHVPRGYCGAEGSLDQVKLVLILAEPGDPDAESYPNSSTAVEATSAYTRNCFVIGKDPFHKNVRFLLDACWPRLSFDEQMKVTWITESVLCSAEREGSPTSRQVETLCRSRYLEEQLKLLPQAEVIALGDKNRHRLRDRERIIFAFHPSARGSKEKIRRDWEFAAAEFRNRISNGARP